jgi:CRISPR-associated protein Cas2
MWMMVLFDLPVGTKQERKSATRFRNDLLDMGFTMNQFSVYLKFCGGKEKAESLTAKISKLVPPMGRVNVLCFTDKQYETMSVFVGRTRAASPKNPGQFTLF